VQLIGVSQFWLQAIIGAAILGTVIFYSRLARRAERSERRSRLARSRS
jgi:ribose/xylose/arabinose/galactoside ABC-type transport system permease subunit